MTKQLARLRFDALVAVGGDGSLEIAHRHQGQRKGHNYNQGRISMRSIFLILPRLESCKQYKYEDELKPQHYPLMVGYSPSVCRATKTSIFISIQFKATGN